MLKNRAKCKLCKSVIESFHSFDYVVCKCGEISVSEGESMKCGAKDFQNFVRVDDDGNEVVVSIRDHQGLQKEAVHSWLSKDSSVIKEDLLAELASMITNIESLPPHALTLPITHYDFCSALILLSSILQLDCKESS